MVIAHDLAEETDKERLEEEAHAASLQAKHLQEGKTSRYTQLTIQYRGGLSCLNAAFPIKMAYIHIIIISFIYKIIQSVYYIVPLFLPILPYTWSQQGARSRGEADVRAARDPTAAAQRPPRAEARLVSHRAI